MFKPAHINPDLLAVLEQRMHEMRGALDFTRMPPAHGRKIELQFAMNERSLMPSVGSAVEIILPNNSAPPLKALHVSPPTPRGGTILYIHGGGWAFGSHVTHQDQARRLSLATGMMVVSISYRLAPEHPFPAGLNDCIAAWHALSGGRIVGVPAVGPLILAGDSAGANLALAAMLNEIDAGGPLPDAALLFYGVYGDNFNTPSYKQWADGPVLTRAKMQRFWDWYCPKSYRQDYRAVPLLAPATHLETLPPLFMAAAEIDPLLSENEQLFRVFAADTTRNDTFTIWPGMVHAALGFANRVDQVREHVVHAGRWVQSKFPINAAKY